MDSNRSKSTAEGLWRNRLERWRRSALSVAAFCRREGVSQPSFYAWRRRLQDGGAAAFVEVEITPGPSERPEPVGLLPTRPSGEPSGSAPHLELIVGRLAVRVPACLDEATLRQLLRLARQEAEQC